MSTTRFSQAWDPSDIEKVWVVWDDLLDGATITESNWTVPNGWTVEASQLSESVTDSNSETYSSANSATLSTTTTRGVHKVSNHVVFSDGREYERSVEIVVRQL